MENGRRTREQPALHVDYHYNHCRHLIWRVKTIYPGRAFLSTRVFADFLIVNPFVSRSLSSRSPPISITEMPAHNDSPSAAPRRTLAVWVATGLGIGFVPFAPGTLGSLWGVALGWSVGQIPSIGGQLLVILLLVAFGIPLCTTAVAQLGGKKDPGCIVWDEIAALPIVYLALDINSPWILAAGFVLFRVFDVSKPPPARWVERLPEGWGVMADDLVAAVYAHGLLRLVLWLGWLPALAG